MICTVFWLSQVFVLCYEHYGFKDHFNSNAWNTTLDATLYTVVSGAMHMSPHASNGSRNGCALFGVYKYVLYFTGHKSPSGIL